MMSWKAKVCWSEDELQPQRCHPKQLRAATGRAGTYRRRVSAWHKQNGPAWEHLAGPLYSTTRLSREQSVRVSVLLRDIPVQYCSPPPVSNVDEYLQRDPAAGAAPVNACTRGTLHNASALEYRLSREGPILRCKCQIKATPPTACQGSIEEPTGVDEPLI